MRSATQPDAFLALSTPASRDAVKLETVRLLALSLLNTTEKPHHDDGPVRVRGEIFVTLPGGVVPQVLADAIAFAFRAGP